MEALERFREASTAQMSPSDISSPEFNPPTEPESHSFQPMPSPAISTPSSLHHSYCLQDQGNVTKCSASLSSSERDDSLASSFQTHPEHIIPTVTPSLDTALSFKPQNNRTDHGLWNFSQAVNIGLNVEGINEPRDAEYHNPPEWPPSDLIKEVRMANTITTTIQCCLTLYIAPNVLR